MQLDSLMSGAPIFGHIQAELSIPNAKGKAWTGEKASILQHQHLQYIILYNFLNNHF
jgi:hypothetical protein